MLPVGEAKAVAAINRRISAQTANRGALDGNSKKTESMLRGMDLSQFELFLETPRGLGR
jgi:hypothetical protein